MISIKSFSPLPFSSYRSPHQRYLRRLNAAVRRRPATATSATAGAGGEENSYTATVLLPVTQFDQRANAVKKEPEIQKWWEENQIYAKISQQENSGEVFTLHDGPPYANGDLHIGHAMNKILKDFVNRYQLLQGKKVRFIPGWDCHGLPIEMKVLQTLKDSERANLTVDKLREIARSFAEETIVKQSKGFQRYGVWGDWQNYYATMQPEYEAAQIRIFGEMVRKGYIYRGRKPVHWSPSSQTALAEAELEYPENHRSRSIYTAFQITEDPSSHIGNDPAYLVIWTTTPWTIPANLAVAVNADISYAIVRHPLILSGAKIIIATDAIDRIAGKFGLDSEKGEQFEVLKTLKGQELHGVKYRHPLNSRSLPVVLGGDYITADSGTGLVHTAPGHGEEDYAVGLKYGLEIFAPVDGKGKFTEAAGADLVGKDVLGDGNGVVIELLKKSNSLIAEESYQHKYPYDWRTKKPTIFRATEQWFASVNSFRQDAMTAIDSVQWVPSIGRNRIAAMVESRGDWCISRQRSWGVPIPVFYKKSDGQPLLTAETIDHIEGVFREHGSNAWWKLSVADLLPTKYKAQADDYERGFDTMDVWFDSGTSWSGVLQQRKDLSFPCDVYLEGSDQSRGWFQSSLLTSVATTGAAPYKTVLTHGFTLDEKGFKMSKSLGNVIDPRDIIEGGKNQKLQPAYGADTLRLWVAGVDYSGDVSIGAKILKQVSESYRKIRNTIRFLLGSINDYDPAKHAVKYDDLPSIDKYMLGGLSKLLAEIETAYSEYQFSKVYQLTVQYITLDLSAFYLDISKDRLYISNQNAARRRSVQTVIDIILNQLLLVIAPILPHLAEEVWKHVPYNQGDLSVFQTRRWTTRPVYGAEQEALWLKLRELKNDVNKAIEKVRAAKSVGAASECKVFIWTEDATFRQLLDSIKGDVDLLPQFQSTNGVDDLRFILAVSQVVICQSAEELPKSDCEVVEAERGEGLKYTVAVGQADGEKCQRCWYYSRNVNSSPLHPHVCGRCANELNHR